MAAALREWPVYLVLVAAGSLYGLTAAALGPWAVLLAGLPYGFVHLAFDRLASASATHRQTIRALGRVPEAGGFSLPGHAERSADLAVAIGGELGLSPGDTRLVEDAALLADIGRVVLGGSGPGFGRGLHHVRPGPLERGHHRRGPHPAAGGGAGGRVAPSLPPSRRGT